MPDSVFDGVTTPQFIVEIGWSYSVSGSGSPDGFILDRSHLDIDAFSSALIWTASDDVLSFSTKRGKERSTDDTGVGTCSITLDNTDGTYDPNNPNGPLYSGSQIQPMRQVRIRAVWKGVTYGVFYGKIDDFEYDFGEEPTCTLQCLDAFERMANEVVPAIVPNYNGDKTGARIGRILDAVSWDSAMRDLATGNIFMPNTDYGDNTLALLNACQTAEQGSLYMSKDGKVTFRDSRDLWNRYRSISVQALFSDTIGDPTADGVMFKSIDVEFGGSQVKNSWTVTRLDFADPPTAIPQLVEDATSISAFTRRSDSISDANVQTDLAAFYLSQFKISQTRNPQFRVRAVTVDMLGQAQNNTPDFVDTGSRTVSGGLGSADTGQAYTLTGGNASEYDVDGSSLTVTLPNANVDHIGVVDIGSSNSDLTWTVSVNAVATADDIAVRSLVRYTDSSNYYAGQLDFLTGGTVQVKLSKKVGGSISTLLSGVVANLGAYAANTQVKVRMQVFGKTLRVKGWLASAAEPANWTLQTTDTDLTTGNKIGFFCRRQPSNTNAGMVISLDNGVGYDGVDLYEQVLGLDCRDRIRTIRNYSNAYTFDRELLLEGIDYEVDADKWDITYHTSDANVLDGFVLDQSHLDGGDVLVY